MRVCKYIFKGTPIVAQVPLLSSLN